MTGMRMRPCEPACPPLLCPALLRAAFQLGAALKTFQPGAALEALRPRQPRLLASALPHR
jgi:hypothetical protein